MNLYFYLVGSYVSGICLFDSVLITSSGSLRTLLFMAAVAGIRCAETDRQVRAGDAKAVIAPRVDDHIGRRRHVAIYAERAGRLTLMLVVLG